MHQMIWVFVIVLILVLNEDLQCYGYLSVPSIRNFGKFQVLSSGRSLSRISLKGSNIYYEMNDIPTQVRPAKFNGRGHILIAQPGEFDHFLHRAVILIYNHSPEHGSVGVILDRASPFTVEGAIPGYPEFRANRLFLGGNDGSDTATIIHKYKLDMSKYLGYGLYLGGLKQASELVGTGQLPASDFKFLFNNVEWGKDVLEKEIAERRWDVCQLPVDWIISQSTEGKLWERCREELRKTNSLLNP